MALLAAGLIVTAGAGSALASGRPGDGSGKLQVVAAENVWGSIAEQLGGERVEVTSVISSPNIEPHSYEPTARDERAIAASDFVVLNGLGYDEWAAQAVDANPEAHRRVLDVGDLLHLETGDDPHRWYHPADVTAVIAAITGTYTSLDPAGAADYRPLAPRGRARPPPRGAGPPPPVRARRSKHRGWPSTTRCSTTSSTASRGR